jgi:hypothetical protein
MVILIVCLSNNNHTEVNGFMSNNILCYWLCDRKAELKVYTDFGNILHLCKKCYDIYDPEHRLKTEEIVIVRTNEK